MLFSHQITLRKNAAVVKLQEGGLADLWHNCFTNLVILSVFFSLTPCFSGVQECGGRILFPQGVETVENGLSSPTRAEHRAEELV